MSYLHLHLHHGHLHTGFYIISDLEMIKMTEMVMVESTSGMSHIRNVASHTYKSGAGYDKHGHGGDDDDHDGGEGNQDEGVQIFRHVVSHMLLLEIEIINMWG